MNPLQQVQVEQGKSATKDEERQVKSQKTRVMFFTRGHIHVRADVLLFSVMLVRNCFGIAEKDEARLRFSWMLEFSSRRNHISVRVSEEQKTPLLRERFRARSASLLTERCRG